jgi:hypothetical protein
MGYDFVSNQKIHNSDNMIKPTKGELVNYIMRHYPGIKLYNIYGYQLNNAEFYCAYPIVKKNPLTGEAHTLYMGVVILIDFSQRGYTGFKVMCENEGPYYYNADKYVIGALSPIDELFSDEDNYSIEQAQKWRQACIIRHG